MTVGFDKEVQKFFIREGNVTTYVSKERAQKVVLARL